MANLYVAPEKVPDESDDRVSVFFAGSFEPGKEENWRAELYSAIENLDVDVYNPDISVETFEWALDHIELATFVVFYFPLRTLSAISLLELGIMVEKYSELGIHDYILVCCPEGYIKRNNVQIVCERYNLVMLNTIEELKDKLRKVLVTEIDSLRAE